ncbi:hypothetical protein, partial [Actinoplanes sp. NPDC051411]|uniref:hypothetical protein n=1 Tax=Actinoplanes sp. NPDC051411 TaxID=3155522 RepID=UPI003437B5B6
MDAATAELGARLHDLLKAIRRMKQRRPAGLVGMLVEVDRLAGGCHARELAAQAALDPSTVSRAVAAPGGRRRGGALPAPPPPRAPG